MARAETLRLVRAADAQGDTEFAAQRRRQQREVFKRMIHEALVDQETRLAVRVLDRIRD